MGLLERLFGRAGAPAQSPAPGALIGPTSVPYLNSQSAVGLSAVWRCVTLIADTVADMPWQEWRGETLLPSSRLVRRPMATMTRREWTWRVVATEALWNTVYCLHVGGSDREGLPWSLMPLPPASIMPAGVPDPYGMVPPGEFWIGGRRIPASFLTIIRRAPWPGVSEWMNGLLELARRQFSAYLAADVHMQRYWAAGGPVITQIKTDQDLDDNDAEAIARRWVNRRAMGSDYPAVMGKGAEAKGYGADPTTESAVEARREINAEIGRYFGMPTRILNAPAGDSETYSNVENDAIDLFRYCLRGYMGPVEDAISEQLPGDYIEGRRMVLDAGRFLQGDLATRATAYAALVTGDRPIFTVAEARTRGFGLPPVPPAPALPLAPAGSPSVTVATTDGRPIAQTGARSNG